MTPKALLGAFCLSMVLHISVLEARFSRQKRQSWQDSCPEPPAPQNGQVSCAPSNELMLEVFCSLTCDPGYKFDGVTDSEFVFVCVVGVGFLQSVVTPPCVATCDPKCLNGGQCIGPNTCTCIAPYYGPQCQDTQQLCTDPAPGRFARMDCQPDGNGGRVCIPMCFPTFVFEYPPPDKYVCNGNDGTWTPDVTNVPSCLQETQTTIVTPGPVTVTSSGDGAICSAWGTNHFRTFDSKTYTFEGGQCRFSLVYAPNLFEIAIINSPGCENGGTCTRSVEIYEGNDVTSLHIGASGPEITWNNQVQNIPGFKNGMIFEQISSYLSLQSNLGFSIKWDGKTSVFTQVSDSLRGNLYGLCGKYNGITTDEFETRSGQQVAAAGDFGSSWKKVLTGDASCPDVKQSGGCASQDSARVSYANSHCDNLQNDPAFTVCHQAVDPTDYIETCKTDCCDDSVESCNCGAMEAYARACLDKGITLSWRNENRCEIICEHGKVYKECGSTCAADCYNRNPTCSDTGCIDGCFCPDGRLLYKGYCIMPGQCPCVHEGADYFQGAVIKELCNNCTCHSGEWSCTHDSCEKTCSATGDPHYETFDGYRYNFMGTCSYYLIKNPEFSIITDNIQCGEGDASCTKSITIDINGMNIKMDHNHQLFINGHEVPVLPYEAPGVKISMVSSLFMQAVLDNGFTVLWDGRTRAYIKAPTAYFGNTAGMCGTFDGNPNNDFISPTGSVESNPNSFGNQWKTESSCADMPETVQPNPCDVDTTKRDQAIALCDQLKTNIFQACHSKVPVQPFHDDCVYDLCSCNDNMKDCMCPNIGSYADTCAASGVKINWRMNITECMLQCPAGQEYKVCGRPCERTCRDIAVNEDNLCDAKCVEGCNCPDGQTLDDSGQCVPISQCPCVFDGRVYSAGFTTLKGNEKCVCQDAKFTCTQISTADVTTLTNVAPLCPANTAYTDCMSNCPVTCENMHHPPTCDNSDCGDGCECIPGYVFVKDKCINATQCPCSHAGKTYYNGESYIQDCNQCTCVGQNWQCTQNDCPATCSSYGESHYTSFDGQSYEFQGACDYVLAQSGPNNPYKFSITTRNSQCGTSGVTCFKQLAFSVGEAGTDTFYKLELIRGQSVIAEAGSPFHVQNVGDMVYITTPFGVTLVWDKQTRVYVQLSTDHMQLVEGLCGNFNRDETDDFIPKSGGSPVALPTTFADSWKVQSSCAPSQEIADTCQSNPQRKSWAQIRCSVLNSDLFQPCHALVDQEPYIRRCEYDACGCDLGGDCECLCTSIAAYAHECAVNGVPLQWRSNQLCPIQCEDCEVFNPCMSLCPKKTCENRLEYSRIVKSCEDKQGMCFEGCDLHPCPAGQVYDSLEEPVTCIPETLCETAACEINGKKYYEGEQVVDSAVCKVECEICICRSGALEHISFGGSCDGAPLASQTTNDPGLGQVGHTDLPGQRTTAPGMAGRRRR